MTTSTTTGERSSGEGESRGWDQANVVAAFIFATCPANGSQGFCIISVRREGVQSVITYVAVAVGYSRTGTRVQHISESNKNSSYLEWACGPGDDHDDDGQHAER
jgi:hypothetical protein